MSLILQVRLRGAPESQFQNIEAPFQFLDDFTNALNHGDLVICSKLRTLQSGQRQRKIIDRSDIVICRDGIDWMMEPSVTFIEE